MAGEDENSYAGRWIARIRGRVVAQGGTPEQARRAAQSRFKETPEVLFMPAPLSIDFPPLLDSVRAALTQEDCAGRPDRLPGGWSGAGCSAGPRQP